ncbi:MAG: M23 family metallopeptidase [Eubacteriales bacterium]|nr:M23 family metallopeptidase [Eubacteriales bacterium]
MENSKFWQGIKRAYLRYDRMMEKQGFYVVLAVCVLVIVLSAFYTFRLREEGGELSMNAEEAQTAGGTQNAQTLKEAQALVASVGAEQKLELATQSPFRLVQPLSGFLDRTFSDAEPQFFAQSNAWQIHAGVDFQAEYGAPVAACASGTVTKKAQDNELGLCVVIDHGNGYQTVYAGLSSADYVQVNDPVSQGQTIGHVGNGVLAENDGLPHLHLEVHKNGKPVDPLTVFLGLDN